MKEIFNAMSVLKLSLGFLSIFFILENMIAFSCYFILITVLIDVSSSVFMKFFRVESDFENTLDSISALVSFVFAPAILSYFVFSSGLEFPFSYLLFALILFFMVSGSYRTARVSSVYIEGVEGLPLIFNGLVFPALYLLDFFSIYIVSGWIILSSVLMVTRFRIRRPKKNKKKKKDDMVEVKESDVEEEEEEKKKKSKKKKDDDVITPLPMFGD